MGKKLFLCLNAVQFLGLQILNLSSFSLSRKFKTEYLLHPAIKLCKYYNYAAIVLRFL